MSQNRDYATHDHAIRYALHEHAEATLALRAAGCPHTEASQVAYRAVKGDKQQIRKGRALLRKPT